MATKRVLISLACGAVLPLLAAGCSSPGVGSAKSTAVLPKESWTDKIARTVKPNSVQAAQAERGVGGTAAPAAAVATQKRQGPSADLSVAMAQMQERNGNFDEARKLYQQAIKTDPAHLGAHVGMARLHDRRNQLEEATSWYQKAVAKHPNEASAYNDLGLCYHRRGMLNEAMINLNHAVKLQPEKKLYRNNLASVLVEAGRPDDALVHLKAAHGDAAGHYNLGYMLTRKGEDQRAIYHFQQAVAMNPSLVEAHDWIARLSPGGSYYAPVALAQRPATTPASAATGSTGGDAGPAGRFLSGRPAADNGRATSSPYAAPSIELGNPNDSGGRGEAPPTSRGAERWPSDEVSRANPVRGGIRYPERRGGESHLNDGRMPPLPGDDGAAQPAAYQSAR